MTTYEVLLRFGTYIGTFILLVGVIYRYVIKHHKWALGKAIMLVVYSYISGNGIVLILKGLDYVFLNSAFFSRYIGGITSVEILGLVAIGSFSALAFILTFAIEFIRDRKRGKKLRNRINSSSKTESKNG